jgi:hypothetical protein
MKYVYISQPLPCFLLLQKKRGREGKYRKGTTLSDELLENIE